MKRIALTSSVSVSFLSFANPEKGDPNSGMFILLSYLSYFMSVIVFRKATIASSSVVVRPRLPTSLVMLAAYSDAGQPHRGYCRNGRYPRGSCIERTKLCTCNSVLLL